MAVLHDAVGPAGGAGAAGTATTLSWTHINAGSVLVVWCAVGPQSGGDGGITTTATYNGVSMTSLGVSHTGGGTAGYVEGFILFNPAQGSNTVQVTRSGGTGTIDLLGCSESATGAGSNGTPVLSATAGSAASLNNVIPSNTGDLTVSGAAAGQAFTAYNQTLDNRKTVNALSGAGNIQSGHAAGSASVTHTHTLAGADFIGAVGVNLQAAVSNAVPTYQGGAVARLRRKLLHPGLLYVAPVAATVTAAFVPDAARARRIPPPRRPRIIPAVIVAAAPVFQPAAQRRRTVPPRPPRRTVQTPLAQLSTFVPVPSVRRRPPVLPRRDRTQPPLPVVTPTTAPAFYPSAQRRRFVPFPPRRDRTQAPLPVITPPPTPVFYPGALRRRLMPMRVIRRVSGVPLPQPVVTTPVFYPAASRRKATPPLRRRVTAQAVLAAVTALIPAGVRRRVVLPPKRGRSTGPVPATVVLAPPVFYPAAVRPRRPFTPKPSRRTRSMVFTPIVVAPASFAFMSSTTGTTGGMTGTSSAGGMTASSPAGPGMSGTSTQPGMTSTTGTTAQMSGG